MREKFGFLVCLWILLWSNCLAGFVVTKNSFRLTSPESIKGIYECAIRNTGVPQYGGTMVGAVFYPGANQRACRNFDGFHISFKSRPGAFSTVLLVDRGDCYYSLKAWYAQKAGAAAVLIADDISEPLICADTPEEDNHSSAAAYLRNITIPSALIDKSLGDSIKKVLRSGEMVNIILDWGLDQSHLPTVKYEFWMNSNYECGPKGDSQIEFVKNFRRAAKTLEQQGYTHFTPHFVTWYCPQAFVLSRQCKSQCINHGRYCAPDPDQDFSNGYDGKDVVVQNLRQACFFKVANESGKPWLWWDYVTSFAIRCPMKEKKYTKECADKVIRSLGRWSRGIDLAKIDKCIGDTGADMKNPVLEAELDAQNGYHGDMLTLPTLVINNRQYRGKLEKGEVLKAMCANFPDNKEPATCFREVIETHVPLQNNDGAGWTESG